MLYCVIGVSPKTDACDFKHWFIGTKKQCRAWMLENASKFATSEDDEDRVRVSAEFSMSRAEERLLAIVPRKHFNPTNNFEKNVYLHEQMCELHGLDADPDVVKKLLAKFVKIGTITATQSQQIFKQRMARKGIWHYGLTPFCEANPCQTH